jgi:arylsulfatase A-like enzyme
MPTRRDLLKAITLASVANPKVTLGDEPDRKPNILFLVVDDLSTCISPYTTDQGVVSPNFERLKQWGVMFEAACVSVPACSPSRTAMLLGQDPMKTEIFANEQRWLDAKTAATSATLVGHFHSNGWTTEGTGKVFHGLIPDLRASDWTAYWLPENYADRDGVGPPIAASAKDLSYFDFGPGDAAAAPDVETTDWTIGRIRDGLLDNGGCFLALGLNRPHLPQIVPQRYFDLYPEHVALPPGYWPGSTDVAGNLPDTEDLGHSARRGLSTYGGSHILGETLTLNHELNVFLRSYYAASSFADDQIGRVLDALEERSLRENTYLVVVSDNGFILGEKEAFTKFDLHEIALRVPLFIAGPGIAPRVVQEPVSLVDLYPTLCGLAGLPVPPQCDGQDLSLTLLSGTPPARSAALSYYGFLRKKTGEFFLHSTVRTPQWRLISYSPVGWRSYAGRFFKEVELYDHDPASPTYDPNEWHNIADEHPDVVAELRRALPPPQTLTLTLSRGGGHED